MASKCCFSLLQDFNDIFFVRIGVGEIKHDSPFLSTLVEDLRAVFLLVLPCASHLYRQVFHHCRQCMNILQMFATDKTAEKR